MSVSSYSFLHIAKFIAQGIIVTLQYSILAVILGFCIGSVLALLKVGQNKYGRIFAEFYTSIFRGTPLLIQLSIIYFAPNQFSLKLTVFQAGVAAFAMNSGAYISEIIRAGVQAVDIGQFEAAKSLSVPYYLTMKDIILPQAFRKILPSLVNELIDMIKESALISMLGEMDIMRRSQIISTATYDFFTPLLIAGLYYYIVISCLSYIAKAAERKLAI